MESSKTELDNCESCQATLIPANRGIESYFDISNYVDYDIICTAPTVDNEILNDINKFTKNKHLVSVGCAEGDFEK